jgi:nicotinamidase-related amidase
MASLDTDRRHPALLRRDDTGLILVDVQEAFRPVIDDFDGVVANCGLLAEGFAQLGLPVLVSEQYPKGLGHTVEELVARLPEEAEPVEKLRFSAIGVPDIDDRIAAGGRRQWVVAGIEAHVCVNQTVHDLIARGHEVHVAGDAVSSRTASNRELGLDKMRLAGARVTSAEMALFELLEEAGSPEFKAISKLVR